MENKTGPGHTLLSSTTDHSKNSGTFYLLGLSQGGEVSSYKVMSVMPGWLFWLLLCLSTAGTCHALSVGAELLCS